MPRTPGVGPRIAQRIIEMGYVQPTGKANARWFAQVFQYDKTLVYEWLADRRTPTKELSRLCKDLEVSHGWLLYGEGGPPPAVLHRALVPIAGGSGASADARPPSVDTGRLTRNIMSTSFDWLRCVLGAGARPLPSPAYAA